jgi:hypothetical protein
VVIDRAFYEVVSCQPPFFKQPFLPPNEGEEGESLLQYSWTVPHGFHRLVFVFVWPGFNSGRPLNFYPCR